MDEVTRSMHAARAERAANITKGFSDPYAEDAIAKGEETDIEKSDIMRAFSGTDAVTITKTGKEIKKQIADVCLPKHLAALESAKTACDEKLKDCGSAPLNEVSPWWTDDIKMDVPYKVYKWDQTYFRQSQGTPSVTASPFDAEETAPAVDNPPASAEQAKCREEYNDLVRKYCEIKVDAKALEIMNDNLTDGASLKLNPKQLAVLHFH